MVTIWLISTYFVVGVVIAVVILACDPLGPRLRRHHRLHAIVADLALFLSVAFGWPMWIARITANRRG